MTLLLRTPLVLDAAARNAATASQLAEHPPGTPVVIVLRDGVARTYHTTTVETLVDRLAKLPKAGRLADTLKPAQAAATMQVGDWKRSALGTFNGVLSAPFANLTVSSRTHVVGCVGGENVTFDTDTTLTRGGRTLPLAP